MLDITGIALNIQQLEDGIWVSRNTRDISYPEDGNVSCFALEDTSFWFKHRNNCIMEAVKRYPPAGAIFDIGGGNGFVSRCINNSGFETVLVEPGMEGARNARTRGINTVICSTLQDAGFCKKCLPAAGIFDVLEHIEDDANFLREIHSYLADEGRLYITVPAYGLLWSQEDDTAGHYRRYTLKMITDKLKQAGYSIDYATYYFVPLILPILLFRAIPGRIGLKRRNPAKAAQNEHIPDKRFNRILYAYLQVETSMIKKRSLPFGASCMVIARKKE